MLRKLSINRPPISSFRGSKDTERIVEIQLIVHDPNTIIQYLEFRRVTNDYLAYLIPGERMTKGSPLLESLSSTTSHPARRIFIGPLTFGDLSGWTSFLSCRIHYGVGGVLELMSKCGHTSYCYIELRLNMDSPAIQTCIRLTTFMRSKANLSKTFPLLLPELAETYVDSSNNGLPPSHARLE